MKSILELEAKIENWIGNNPFKWGLILIGISYSVSFLGIYFFGMGGKQAFVMGTIYAIILIIVELSSRNDKK